MYVIDRFTADTPHGKSQWTKKNVLYLIRFVPLEQIPKTKICHMVASEHTEAIEGRQILIATDLLEYEEAYEDGSIDISGDALYGEDGSGFWEAGVRSGVIQSGT